MGVPGGVLVAQAGLVQPSPMSPFMVQVKAVFVVGRVKLIFQRAMGIALEGFVRLAPNFDAGAELGVRSLRRRRLGSIERRNASTCIRGSLVVV